MHARYEQVTEPYSQRILSADSHIVEPPDLWTTRMDRRWRERAPRIEALDETGDYFIIDGMRPRPLAFEGPMADIKAAGLEIPAPKGYRYADHIRPGCYDPDARMQDQDIDGVAGELIYPGLGLFMALAPDADYQLAACRVYNDWLAGFCGAHPNRLKGMAVLPTAGDLRRSADEAERCRKLGLVGAMLPVVAPGRPYNLPDWDVLWRRLEALAMPCSLHVGGGQETFGRYRGPGAGALIVCGGRFDFNIALQQVIWGGAPERFPNMKWVITEGGIGWIAAALGHADAWWHEGRARGQWMDPPLPQPPSFYFRRNFAATFEDDRAGILTREVTGVETLLWGSDYPHTEGVWPFSRKQIAHDFAGIPAADTQRIVHDNTAAIFGFPTA
jgi:predicted TIM-barrel fold metal-dependent hydrolase